MIQYAKASAPEPGDAEYFRRCALEELDREIDLDDFEHVLWATDEHLNLEFRQYVQPVDGDGHYVDDHVDLDSDDFDEALGGLMYSEPAHPFLMSLTQYRARCRLTK